MLKKTFSVGTLRPGERWRKDLDSPVTQVARADFFYTCDQGAGKGTLDVENPENNKSAAQAAIERVLKQDQEAGAAAGGPSKVASAMRAIDLKGCPGKFQAAYKKHISAWESNDKAAIENTFAVVKDVAREHDVDVSGFN